MTTTHRPRAQPSAPTTPGWLRRHVEGLWMLPLGLLSFLAFRVVRAVLARLIERQTFKQPAFKPGWRPFSARTLKLKWYLPFLMTRAPRWNPHALIANAGPFAARRSIRVRVGDADAAARDWTVVLYAHPSYRTLQSHSPAPEEARSEWIELPVQPGEFTLSLRYYLLRSATPAAPAIEIDGVPYCAAQPLSPADNDFYRTLAREHNTRLYRAIQYYVYVLLRFQRWFGAGFVKREVLPVGNPATHFAYGMHRAGERVRVQMSPQLFERSHAYLTVYECGSFPVEWIDLAAPHAVTSVQARAGFHVLRVCAKSGQRLEGDDRMTVEAI
jgi:hypothetical protein